MKKIEAIVKPFRLDNIRDALSKIGVDEIIVTDIRCAYSTDKVAESYLSEDYFIEFLPKIRIEVFVEKEKAEQSIQALKKVIEAEDADSVNKERVFVYDVTEA